VTLCVLLSLFSLSRQAEDVDDAIDGVQARDAVETRPITEPTNAVRIQASFAGQRESELVDDAWAILRALKPAAGENVRNVKPSGLQGTIWHYVIVSFRLLFMNGPPQVTSIPRDAAGSKKPTSLGKAVGLLKEAAALEDPNAIFLLAEMNFYGNFTHPRNLSVAFEWYDQLASLNGNSTAQHMLGFMYATGVGDIVERDQAKALLYHTYAADQGDTRSEMTVAFRHHAGIGTARNCDTASQYYKRVADKVIAYWRAGPPG
jgi:SEL1 protein